jgi:glycosyltransferase involved in cell wall biosynthesis
MRIGIPLKSHDPAWGGPGVYTVEIVKHLLALDRHNEYVLLYPSATGPMKYFGQYQGYHNVFEVDTRVTHGWYSDLIVLPRIAQNQAIDVLFSPFMAIPLRGRFQKVMTIHGAERYTVPGLLTWKGYLKWYVMEKLMLPQADCILAVSHTMQRDFCKALGFPPERVRTTYLGVNPTFCRLTGGECLQRVRERYQLPKDFILFVGLLFPNKNFTNLLQGFQAIAKTIPHHLVVVGGRRWKYKHDVAQVQILGLTNRVQFLNFVPQEDLVALYNLATCFVFPSLYESFGLAQLEAMACGCPVVAASTGALPEIAGGAAILCDPRDPADIGRAIYTLICDPALRAAYIEKGIARARDFTWERCATETLQVLESVFQSRSTVSV